ncbi:MAG: LysR family transcriptional regulator, partial [Actinomycetia bacterium]|nr:LysR family transcriptional regulator [Actinomycetes bacterium]
MYDLRQLEVLVAIVDHGSFTRAAEALHIAQPAVSQHMKSLETKVGGELIDRKTKRPTAAGLVLIAHARRALRELETAEFEVGELSGLKRGTVRIGAIHWLEPLDLPALLGAFAKQFPGITIELREENAHVMFDLLGVGDMDLVFSNISPTDTITSDLKRQNLFSEDLVVVVGQGDPLGDYDSCDLADL